MNQPQEKPLILFVDDEELTRKYFRRLFGRAYEVHTASSGEEAVQYYEQHKERIGIVVTDQLMPGMTGLNFLQILRKSNAPIVRVLSSAFADANEVEEALNNGLVEFFLSKPWDLEEVQKTLLLAEAKWRDLVSAAA